MKVVGMKVLKRGIWQEFRNSIPSRLAEINQLCENAEKEAQLAGWEAATARGDEASRFYDEFRSMRLDDITSKGTRTIT